MCLLTINSSSGVSGAGGGGGWGVLAFLTYPWGPAVSRTCPTVINAASFRNALMVGDRFASTYSIGNSEFY